MNCKILPWLIVIMAISGCRDAVIEDFRRAEILYRTNDIHVAEKAMLDHREDLFMKKASNVRGIDYDTSLGIANGRLFLIYQQLGDSNKANFFYQESVACLEHRRKEHGIVAEELTPRILAEEIEKNDSFSPVLWKTNVFTGTNSATFRP